MYKQNICNYLAKHNHSTTELLSIKWRETFEPFHWFFPTAFFSSPYSATPLALRPLAWLTTGHWPPSQGADELHESWCTHPWPTQSSKPHWHPLLGHFDSTLMDISVFRLPCYELVDACCWRNESRLHMSFKQTIQSYLKQTIAIKNHLQGVREQGSSTSKYLKSGSQYAKPFWNSFPFWIALKPHFKGYQTHIHKARAGNK